MAYLINDSVPTWWAALLSAAHTGSLTNSVSHANHTEDTGRKTYYKKVYC